MDIQTTKSFQQWDQQTNNRTIAHINMSNLYLAIERGETELNRHTANQLWLYFRETYPPSEGDPMRKYWEHELLELPNGDQYFS